MKLWWFPACRGVLGYIVLPWFFQSFLVKDFCVALCSGTLSPFAPWVFQRENDSGSRGSKPHISNSTDRWNKHSIDFFNFKRSLTCVDVYVEKTVQREMQRTMEMERNTQRAPSTSALPSSPSFGNILPRAKISVSRSTTVKRQRTNTLPTTVPAP